MGGNRAGQWGAPMKRTNLSYQPRQTPFQGGPERASQRPPHVDHVDWHKRYPLHGPTDQRQVSLTFDDGPDDIWTPRILDVLKQFWVKASFQCVGTQVQSHPQMLRRIANEGHVVENHSWDHPNFTQLSSGSIRREIEDTTNLIEQCIGVRPRFFRPPYGALNQNVIEEVQTLNYKILLWSVDSLDWAGLTAKQTAVNVLSHTTPGSIILMHFAGGRGGLADTVEALPRIISTLHRRGYSFVTIPQLLKQPGYQ